MTSVCNGYPKVQIFKKTVINIQNAIGGLQMSSLRRSSPPKLTDTYWAKEAANVVCQNQETKDWLHSKVLEMKAGRAPHAHTHTHTMVGMEVLVIYKIIAAWFLSPPEDTNCLVQCLCRLNQGLNTGQ
jgi:hypothetical protein